MSEKHSSVENMWNKFCETTSIILKDSVDYEAYNFCDDELNANELADLVLEGKKTATTSLHCLYEMEGEKLPEEDQYSIILNWAGEAQCIIRNLKVEVLPFNKVSVDFARSEGEGDMSLEYWRKVHRDVFIEVLKGSNREFSEDMLVVCEEFEVVFWK